MSSGLAAGAGAPPFCCVLGPLPAPWAPMPQLPPRADEPGDPAEPRGCCREAGRGALPPFPKRSCVGRCLGWGAMYIVACPGGATCVTGGTYPGRGGRDLG